MNAIIKIEGMSCGHCEKRVMNALSSVTDLKIIRVSAAEDLAEIEYNDDAVLQAAYDAIEDAGYDIIK